MNSWKSKNKNMTKPSFIDFLESGFIRQKDRLGSNQNLKRNLKVNCSLRIFRWLLLFPPSFKPPLNNILILLEIAQRVVLWWKPGCHSQKRANKSKRKCDCPLSLSRRYLIVSWCVYWHCGTEDKASWSQ